MNVIFVIQGKEAIPIRALPFVTGWTMSPDVVSTTFAHVDSWRKNLRAMSVFHLKSDGSYSALLPKEWDGVMAELLSLSNMYQMDEKFEGGNYVAWRRDSIPILPPSCFVWRDEFEAAFNADYSKYKYSIVDEREGDRELNFSPLVPERLESSVMQGFEFPKDSKVIVPSDKFLSTIERESLFKLVIGMAVSGYRYNSNAARNDAIGEISRDLDALGIGLDQNTIRKWIEAAAKLLPSKPKNT